MDAELGTHGAALIETLALALGAAFLGGLVARRIRLPSIAGYLLAGVVIGPFTPGLLMSRLITPLEARLGARRTADAGALPS